MNNNMFSALRFFMFMTVTVYLSFNDVSGGDKTPSQATRKPSREKQPALSETSQRQQSELSASATPFQPKTGQTSQRKQSKLSASATPFQPKTGPAESSSRPINESTHSHYGTAGYDFSPSTGFYNPSFETIQRIDARYFRYRKACVANIFLGFDDLQKDRDRVIYAITSLSIGTVYYKCFGPTTSLLPVADSLQILNNMIPLKIGHTRGFYHHIKSYVKIGHILHPNKYCETFSPDMLTECVDEVEIFGKTNFEALDSAYFKLKISDLTNHRRAYMEHICDNFEMLPDIPTPQIYCRFKHDYSRKERNDYIVP